MRVIAPASIAISRASSSAVPAWPIFNIHSGFHCASVRSCSAMRSSISRRMLSINWNSRWPMLSPTM